MKYAIRIVLMVSALSCATQAFAQDTSSKDSSTKPSMSEKHQMMKDCMDRQKASNPSMSKSDMRKACKDEMKAQQDSSMQKMPKHDTTPK
jgi:pentapeptide MXKDX repeat protein